MKEVFKTIDTDGNGRLSKEELIAAYSQTMPIEQANATVEAVMSKVDADKNGFIDYSEFCLATMSEKVLLSKNNMESAFRMFDKDGSGSITVAELREMLGEDVLAANSVWEELVKQADQNGDGEIDLKEFKDLLMSLFV
jgi:calcium-dependent protein kinase